MLDDIALLFKDNQLLFLSLIAVLGVCVGSFLNVVIYRVPIMLERRWTAISLRNNGEKANAFQDSFNLFLPRSHCPLCKKNLSTLHNIPILSYLILRGKSACCTQIISLRYPLIEAFTMGLSFFVAVHYGVSWQCLAALAFSWALIALFFIDLEHKILPDSVTLSLFWVGLLINTAHIFTSPESALIGAAVGYFIFWSIAFLYQRLRHIEGLGQGDAKLLAACGAWLGWQMLPLIILFSSLLGTVIGSLYLIIRKRNVQEQIPFGPFIAIAAFISMIWGHDIISYYLNLTRMSS